MTRRNGALPGILILSLLSLLSPGRADAQTGDVFGTDPSIARLGDTAYLFTTGPGVPIRTSKDLVTWKREGRVLEQMPQWVSEHIPNARGCWAPDVRFYNGKWHVYYAVSQFGRNTSVIGLATNETLDPSDPKYKWVDGGMVIETRQGDDFNAIDPNIALDAQGKPWMTLGSFWTGIKMIRIDPTTGLRSKDDPKIYSLARRPSPDAIEAPFIVRKGEFYYLFVSFDYCCRGLNSTYNIRVGRSKQITGPYVDRDGKSLMEAGGTVVLETTGSVIGPGHNAVLQEPKGDWLVHHFYDGEDGGVAKLQIRPLKWDDQGWPTAGEPVAKPPKFTGPRFGRRGTTRATTGSSTGP